MQEAARPGIGCKELPSSWDARGIDYRDINEDWRVAIDRKRAVEAEILSVLGKSPEKVDLSAELSAKLYHTLMQVEAELSGKSDADVLSYLRANGFQSTEEHDMPLIARA